MIPMGARRYHTFATTTVATILLAGCGPSLPMAGVPAPAGVGAAATWDWDKYHYENVFVNLDADSIVIQKAKEFTQHPDYDLQLVAQIKGGSKLTVAHNKKEPQWSDVAYRGTSLSSAKKHGWAREALAAAAKKLEKTDPKKAKQVMFFVKYMETVPHNDPRD